MSQDQHFPFDVVPFFGLLLKVEVEAVALVKLLDAALVEIPEPTRSTLKDYIRAFEDADSAFREAFGDGLKQAAFRAQMDQGWPPEPEEDV